MRNRLVALLFAAALVLTIPAGVVSAQANDPVVGNWTLDVSKSKFSPGRALQKETRSYSLAGNEIKALSTRIDSTGKVTTGTWTVVYDGKDRPQTGEANTGTFSQKRIDANTTQFSQKMNGKTIVTGTRVVSKDGKTMTITSKGTSADGKPIDEVLVYVKQ
jgi:hypothetical protein